MKSLYLFTFLIAFMCSNELFGQQPDTINIEDKQLIQNTIQTYFDGWMTGDTAKLGSAMHSTCHLKFVRDGQVVKISRNDYLSKFKPRPKSPDIRGRILAIDITRNAAAATCEIEIPDRLFTDYFNLLKSNGQWYIVDKISTSMNK